jgi:hypothetical protein
MWAQNSTGSSNELNMDIEKKNGQGSAWTVRQFSKTTVFETLGGSWLGVGFS